jgi:uncharacterized membrane-anchored protein
MPDWEKLNRELDQALSEMSDEDWKEWYSKRNKKYMKTSVEWLVEQLDCLNRERKENLIDAETFFKDKAALIQQAKGMEKEQICNAYRVGWINHSPKTDSEQYYNETFKSE